MTTSLSSAVISAGVWESRRRRRSFSFIDALPGKKIILKGNHDYWWSTAAKAKRFFAQNGITTIDILYNNSFDYGEYAICGTRGWFYEEEKGDAHDAQNHGAARSWQP